MRTRKVITLLISSLLVAILSCAKSSSNPATPTNDIGTASSGMLEVIIDSSANITGPEVSCAGTECSTTIMWEE